MNIILIAEIFYVIIVLAACLREFYESSTTSKAVSYLLLIIFVPILGIIFYFTLGNDYRKNKIYSKKLIQDENLYSRIKSQLSITTQEIIKSSNEPALLKNKNLAHLLLLEGSPLSDQNEVELLINGEGTFPKIKEALLTAKHHIHLEYYIYENDQIGNEIKEILIQKAKEGVSVRFIYDDFGSSKIRKKFADELKANGVEIFPFYKITFIKLANRSNYRNHRKIIIIDGEVSFVGGINVSDKYINTSHSDLYWRDTHLKIVGPGTRYLQYLFLCDWNFCAEKNIRIEETFFNPEMKGNGQTKVQIAASGPDSDQPTILYSILHCIGNAKKEILITSPYFIPDESLTDALKVASLSGVKIKLIVPQKADSVFVNAAASSYYGDLLQVGVEIFCYTKGFIHAKTLVIDEEISMVGTANMDVRSFELNFEVNAVIYDTNFSKTLKRCIEEDIENSIKIDPNYWLNRNIWKTLPEKVARLFSPLL